MTTTLADLDTHLLAFPDALPPHGVHAARKALARLAQAVGRPATAVLLEGALSDHAALKADLGKCWYDEHAALERLLELPRLPADLIAHIRTGTATMADAKGLVAMQEWGDERVRIRAMCRIIAGIRCVPFPSGTGRRLLAASSGKCNRPAGRHAAPSFRNGDGHQGMRLQKDAFLACSRRSLAA